MKTSILYDWDSVSGLKHEWNRLLENTDAHRLFLSWEWVESWIATIQNKTSPYFITVRDEDDRLVGIAPFYRAKTSFLGFINFATLRLAADYSTGFEYTDLIVDPSDEVAILDAIGEALSRSQSQWDLIWLPKISGWTRSLQRIERAIRAFPFNTRSCDFSSIPLPETIEQYDGMFSSKRRNQQRRLNKRVFSDATAEFVNCRDPKELDHFLEALFKLHHKRRMLLNDPGTFIRRPSQETFYRQFAPKALANGWLRIIAIKAQGEIQAIQLGYVCDTAYLQMQEGFNPEYIEGTGNVLRHHAIAQCIEEGLREYDFLGGFTEHKRRWGAKQRQGHNVLIGNQSLKSRLLIKLKIWPTGRYLQQHGLID